MPTAVDREQTTALAVIETAVRKEQRRLKALLPPGMSPARVIDTVLAAARKTPKIQECSTESIIYAMREAARWGLVPDGVMGQGYLIPRWNSERGVMEAHFQAGYRGLEDLARRSGVVGSIVSGWHCQNDPVFKIRMGTNGSVDHEPAFKDRGDILGFYAAAWLLNGAPPVVVYMEVADVIRIRDAVPKWNTTPWRPHFAQMGRKTVVRRLVQQLPLSPDVQAIIGLDDAPWERAIDVTPAEDAAPTALTTKARRMQAMLEGRRNGETGEAGEAELGGEADGSEGPVESEAARQAGDEPDRAEAPDTVTGVIRLPDRAGLNGIVTDSPAGRVIGFRVDTEGDQWVQVILSGDVLERYLVAEGEDIDKSLAEGVTVTVVGRQVIVPRSTPDGLEMPPVIRIIATEDIQWQST